MSLKLDGTTGTGNNSITCDASNNLLYNGIKLITVNNADDLIPVATINAAGLMSSSDKRKLNKIKIIEHDDVNNSSVSISLYAKDVLFLVIPYLYGNSVQISTDESKEFYINGERYTSPITRAEIAQLYTITTTRGGSVSVSTGYNGHFWVRALKLET